MPPKIISKTRTSWKYAGESRRSQIVSSSGPGAIVDFPRISAIMSGIDSWRIYEESLPTDAKFSERNLEKMLGKEFFVQVSTDDNDENKFRVPIYRFPRYYYCPQCHMLDTYKKISLTTQKETEYNKVLYCNNPKCKKEGKPIRLIPSRFVVACCNGHIDDFPYFQWAHRNFGFEGTKHNLQLEYAGNTGGLEGIVVKCTCGAEENMAGCMNKGALSFMRCTCAMPWLGMDADNKGWYRDPEGCQAEMRVMQRSANNVYYPVTQSALTIPPWSTKIQQVLKRHNEILSDIFDEDDEERKVKRLKRHYNIFQREYKCSEAVFLKEANRRYQEQDDTEITEEVLRVNEYYAFCDNDRNESGDYFCTKGSEVPEELEAYIDTIKIVSRLREVKVLLGFRRIDPAYENDAAKRVEEGLLDREFTPISKQPLDWLPAIQMYGEGIFIRLKGDAVSRWEEKNRLRYKEIENRLTTTWIGHNMFNSENPRYILLHTFAHLLIRQLSAACGYSSSALREKIYSTFNGSNEEMSGLLIYTSATDSDGSLGGLAREGDGYRLGNTILSALEDAMWCSNDPLCIDSRGQGLDGLNRAACHACTLLPETSCESSNALLDRASLVGTPEDREIGYFSKLIDD